LACSSCGASWSRWAGTRGAGRPSASRHAQGPLPGQLPPFSPATSCTYRSPPAPTPQILQRRYLDNVPSIVPLLEREYRNAAARLEATRAELNDLAHDRLKVGPGGHQTLDTAAHPAGRLRARPPSRLLTRPITHPPTHPAPPQDKGRSFREEFLSKLALLLRGTVAAPADRFGETLADEHLRGGEGER
jgi:hypothetical protein